MLLDVKDIHVHYGNAKALDSIVLEVEERAIVTLIGVNGAGKSTTLRAISGLIHPSSGEIWFMGGRIDRLPPQDIVKLGIAQAPEGRCLFPRMSVSENLYAGAYLRKDKDKIQTDLETVFGHFPILKERWNQHAGTLSGGEQQMLAIGRSLMSNPKLLLLDEPSHGLAPFLVIEIAKIIRDINKRGITILLVEQNARLALQLAHKAYVLETGRVSVEGLASELLQNEKVKKAYLGV